MQLVQVLFNIKVNYLGNMYNVNSTNAPPAAGGARPVNINYDANRSGRKEVVLVVPLKYLGNFWRALNMPLLVAK